MIYLEAKNLKKKYKNKIILDELNFKIHANQRIGIVGPNGCGKTTLCETLIGLRKIDDGEINIHKDIRIGMQLQESKYVKGITGRMLLNYYVNTFQLKVMKTEIEQILELLQIERFIDKDIINLSGGQQQRINILLAIINNPHCIILDELSSGLDLESKDRIYLLLNKFLEQDNKSLLLISHNMEEIEKFCDTLMFMYEGKITKIINIKEIIAKYSSVEEFVRQSFKEYGIGIYKQENLNNFNDIWKEDKNHDDKK